MTTYWLGVSILIVIALLLLIVPIKLSKSVQQLKQVKNQDIARARLKELEEESTQQLLTEEEREASVAELKMALVSELSEESTKTSGLTGLQGAFLLLPVLLCIGIYLHLNPYQEINDWNMSVEKLPELGQRIVINPDPNVTQEEFESFALALRTRLQKEPGDAVGWLLLGRVLTSLGDVNGGITAYAKSYKLDPNRLGLLTSYSQALLLTDNEENIIQAKSLLERSLTQEKSQSTLGLMAIATTRLGEKEEAIKVWNELASYIDKSDPLYAEVQSRIKELQEVGTQLIVNVNLDESMREKLPANGFLFVFVKDANSGMNMPAAVTKVSLSSTSIIDEAFQVILDDSSAMVDGYSLSTLSKGHLFARISSDGSVTESPGDLQGELIIDITTGVQAEHSINIDKELM